MAGLARQAVIWRQQIQQQHQAQDDDQGKPDDQQGTQDHGTGKPNGDTGQGQGQPNGDQSDDGQRTDWKAKSRFNEDRAKANLRERDEARAEAQKAKDQQAAVLKALGLNPDGSETVDPEKLKADRDAALADVRAVKVEAATYRLAGKVGADADALTDSRAYTAAVKDLDPSSATFAADLEAKIRTVLENNPRLKAGGTQQDSGPGSSTGTGHHSGGQGTKRAATTEEAIAARYAAQAAAKK